MARVTSNRISAAINPLYFPDDYERHLDRHLGLDVRRLARAVLSGGRAEETVAQLVFDAVFDDRGQWVVLPHAVLGSGRSVAEGDAGGFSVCLEGVEIHHPLEAAYRE